MKKHQYKFIQLLLALSIILLSGKSLAQDFIVPNSGGESISIDISTLNQLQSLDVTIGDFTDQPRTYKNNGTSSLVIPLPATTTSQKTVTIRAGGSSVSKTVSFRPSPDGDLKLSLLPETQIARGANSVTKISDGRIVLAGGSKRLVDSPFNSVEIFDPETGETNFALKPNGSARLMLARPRTQHTATYIGLNNSPIGNINGPVEQILLIGGVSRNGMIERSIEVLEIRLGTNQAVSTLIRGKGSKLKKGRLFHTSSLLPDGRVLIAGGQGRINMGSIGALNSIEIYNPATNTVETSGISLNDPRQLHSATTLQDGSLLIAGGFTNEEQNNFGIGPALITSELIDTKNLTIMNVGDLIDEEGIGGHSATLLTNGLVLFAGGSSDFFADRMDSKGLTRTKIQFYNPANQTFAGVLDIGTEVNVELTNSRFAHTSVLLPNGDVAIIGGLSVQKGTGSNQIASNPVSEIEVIRPNTAQFNGTTLEAEIKSIIKTGTGRVQPSAIVVTPKNKTQGLLSTADAAAFVNSAVFLSGGFTNGAGALPTKSSELIQIDANSGIEGRNILVTPSGLIRGGFVNGLNIQLDTFAKLPTIQSTPQTVNLSSSNDFMASVMITTSDNSQVLLKSEPNTSIIVSPSIFQAGESITITRANTSITGEFELSIVPVSTSDDFVPSLIKVNVSDSSKPILTTVPGSGVSLSTFEGSTSEIVTVKVLSEGGNTELTSIPPTTMVTATIMDANVATLGNSGITSIVGTLETEFVINAVNPGSTSISFNIDFPDVLGTTIPIQVSGSPSFSDPPLTSTTLTGIEINNNEFDSVTTISESSFSIDNFRSLPNGSYFPTYVPVNLMSSIDNSTVAGLFTIRPLFGVDLFTSTPRGLVNDNGDGFRRSISASQMAIAGLASDNIVSGPIAVGAYSDGIRSLNFDENVDQNIISDFNRISMTSDIKDLKVYEVDGFPKIAAIRNNMLFIFNGTSGSEESSTTLSSNASELLITEVDGELAAVISVGNRGVDLAFPLTGVDTKVVNFQVNGNVKNITLAEKLNGVSGPFVIAYDGNSQFSIINLKEVASPIEKLTFAKSMITKIDYVGKLSIGNSTVDAIAAASGRRLELFDITNKKELSIAKKLNIRSNIRDLAVVDGIAYLALGNKGILSVRLASLLDSSSSSLDPEIVEFTENRLAIQNENGTDSILTKRINAVRIGKALPFLLCGGNDNDLTVIKVQP